MKHSLAIGIVVLLLLGLGAWWVAGRGKMRPTTTPPTTPPSAGQPSPPTSSSSCLPAEQLPMTLTIDYRNGQWFAEGGSEPSDTFCVRRGATVTFRGQNLWVASDPHPVHTDLPGFDALGAKETYSFTFTRVGQWGFHNHLRPSETGTIIVVE